MDDDSEDEFVHLLQLMLVGEQQPDEFEDELLACVGLVCYGLEEAQHNSVLRRYILLVQTFSLIHAMTLPGRHFIMAKMTVHSSPLWA